MAKKKPKLSDFRPQTVNANKHTQRARGLLEKSVREDGYSGEAMVAAADGELFIGSHRLEVSGEIFSPDVEPIIVESDGTRPVIVKRTDIPNADDPRAKRLGLGSNRIAQLSLDWDVDVLQTFDLPDLDAIGFGQNERFGLEERLHADAEPQIDRAEELLQKWKCETGQLWQIGNHRLIVGDCTDAETVARVMGREKAGACVTDPPYGQNQEDVTDDDPEGNLDLLIGCVAQMPIDNGIVIAFESPRMFPNWMQAISDHKFLRALWLYKEAQMANPWRGWILKSEMILISEIGKGMWLDIHPFAHDCYKVSEVSYRTEKIAPVRPHGSVKPLSVVQDLVSRVGGDIYEPFLGSGTTMVASENLKRKCYAIEKDPAYCSVALERMAQAFPALDIRRISPE